MKRVVALLLVLLLLLVPAFADQLPGEGGPGEEELDSPGVVDSGPIPVYLIDFWYCGQWQHGL